MKPKENVVISESLREAIKDILVDKKSIRSVACHRNIPNSSLQRYLARLKDVTIDPAIFNNDVELEDFLSSALGQFNVNKVFSIEQEMVLSSYIKKCSIHSHSLSVIDITELAYQFAKEIHVEVPQSWEKEQKAGKSWYYSFIARNPASTLQTPEPQSNTERKPMQCAVLTSPQIKTELEGDKPKRKLDKSVDALKAPKRAKKGGSYVFM